MTAVSAGSVVGMTNVELSSIQVRTIRDETFEFRVENDKYVIVENGQIQEYRKDEIDSYSFSGGSGDDVAVIHGSAGDEAVVIGPDSATVTLPGLELTITNVEEITVFGEGGNDVATFYDSADDDTFVGKSDYAAMYGEGYYHRVRGFGEVRAESTEGGEDVAKFYDSAGDDTLVTTPDSAELSGDGFRVEAAGFAAVHAFATAGGNDTAEFHDSPGNDQFVTSPTYAALFGEGFYNRAKFFENTRADSTEGTDVAKFYDSPADDEFVATPTHAALSNPDYREEYTAGFHNVAKNFAAAHAYATAGGNDVAKLYDSPDDDTFVGHPDHGALFRHGEYYNRAKFFDAVHAFATAGGTDVARMHGSDGPDTYHLGSDEATVYRPGQYYNRAKYFDEVHRDAGDPQIDFLSGTRSIDGLWVPDEQPSDGTSGQGNFGSGAFPASHDDGGTKVHLFQAADGDINGDRIVNSFDIMAILASNSFPDKPLPRYPVGDPQEGELMIDKWDWQQGDFDGNATVNSFDISAILAAGMYPWDASSAT